MYVVNVEIGKIRKKLYLKNPPELYVDEIISFCDGNVKEILKEEILKLIKNQDYFKEVKLNGFSYSIEVVKG